MEEVKFKNFLKEKTLENNIVLNDRQIEDLLKYKEMLLEWNEKINLTAITEEKEVIVKHFVDSLESIKYIKKQDKIIDVGTGAGFPGLVIAIYFREEVQITLLDSLNKRVLFLEEVVKTLKLNNVKVLHGRAEEISKNIKYRETYDIAIARAVAQTNILLEYLAPFIKIGGSCILMKGSGYKEEINSSSNAIKILGLKMQKVNEYFLQLDETYTRNIIELKKVFKTPEKYARSYGKIKNKPL